LELAGAEHPSEKEGSTLAPVTGKSLRPLFAGAAESVRSEKDWIGWEMFGNRAIRQGDWKLLYLLKEAGGAGDWQLFNLRDDPAELYDVSEKNSEKRTELLQLWEQYVKDNGVILSGDGPFATRKP
jgi:arylsulfatase